MQSYPNFIANLFIKWCNALHLDEEEGNPGGLENNASMVLPCYFDEEDSGMLPEICLPASLLLA